MSELYGDDPVVNSGAFETDVPAEHRSDLQ